MTSIESRLNSVKQAIASSAEQCNRHIDELQLLPVTKNHSSEKISELYQLGERQFAENRVQEMIDKANELPKDIHWHLIGPLQSNKVRNAIKVASTIQSVDNIPLVERINRIAEEEQRSINIYIQVNLTGEIQKSGANTLMLPKILKVAFEAEHIKLRGLMTMGALSSSQKENYQVFSQLKDLADQYSKYFEGDAKLSMGMSGDFPEAIRAGAHILRVGSSIMGERAYEV